MRTAVAAVLAWYVGLAFAPVFGAFPGPGAFLLAVSVAVLAALSPLVAVRRLGPLWTALAGSVAVTVAGLAVTGAGLDVVHGPWRLLTMALPADASGAVLAAVAIAAGWGALSAVLPVAYSSGPLAPLIGPAVALVCALALSASAAPLPGWYGAGLVLLLACHFLVARPRRQAPALAVVALSVVVAALLGPAAPGVGARTPADARALVAAPVQPRSGVSPLQRYLALRDGTIPLKLTGRVSRPGTPLRMATLTRFDGTYWTVAGDYRLAGKRLPPDLANPTLVASVTQEVTVEAGDLDWLVTAGRPSSVSVAGLGVDQATGDVAVPLGATPPPAYTATSAADDVTVPSLDDAAPAPALRPLAPPLPPVLAGFVQNTVADAPSPLDKVLALYHRLATSGEFAYDEAEEVAGGHGYYQLLRLLETHRGTSEQYASAYAVMARSLGYDARVVMGFRPTYDGDNFVAAGRDVAAWVELRLDGIGWVPADPSPRGNPIGTRPDAPSVGAAPVAPSDPIATLPTPDPSADLVAPPAGALAAAGGPWPVVLAVVAGVLAVVLIAPTTRYLRRSRRRRSSGRRLVLGAWWETVDLLRVIGRPAGPSLTTGEVAALVELPGIGELASLVDEAAFAPLEPAPAVGARAWTVAAAIRRELLGRQSRWRRLGTFLNPRL